MRDPQLSVAMSVFNNAPYLAAAIESILDQTFTDFEFLIVDDGSTDDSAAIIDRFAAQDSRIRAIHQANHGLIFSLNRLIAEARAPLIARMDGDDIAKPNRFERQIAYLAANPDIGVLGTGAETIDELGRPGRQRFDNVTNPEAVVEDLKNGPPLCHPSVVMRRDVVRSVGGYHAAYLHCEDYDLWLRLSEITRMTSLPERLILYRQSASQVSNRHALSQQIGAAVAWEAHLERMAQRSDPTQDLKQLPSINELDSVFGREGTVRTVRGKVVRQIVYSPTAMRNDDGFQIVLDHLADGGNPTGMWRTVARLVKFKAPIRALRLASLLAFNGSSSKRDQPDI